jgi:glycosyltransferase involved in cell wall biosynthesis
MKRVLRLASSKSTIVFPEGDHSIIPWLSVRSRGQNLVFLVMRGALGPTSQGWRSALKRFIIVIGRRRGSRIAELVSALACTDDGNAKSVVARDLVPRPTFPEKNSARREFGFGESSLVLLLAGRIDDRKSPGEILAWLEMSSLEPRVNLLVVGGIDETCKGIFYGSLAQQLKSSGRLVVRDEYVDDRILQQAYAAADAVLVLYANHAPSGVVAFSIVAERPLIAWNNRTIVRDVERFGVGIVLENRDPATLEAAASQILGSPTAFETRLREASANLGYSFFVEVTGLSESPGRGHEAGPAR